MMGWMDGICVCVCLYTAGLWEEDNNNNAFGLILSISQKMRTNEKKKESKALFTKKSEDSRT